MSDSDLQPRDPAAALSFWLLAALLTLLWVAGGASRADVPAQAVVRLFACLVLAVFAFFSPRFAWRSVRPVALFLGLGTLLAFLQLVPLPPAVWLALPGRDLLAGAAEVSGQPQPWRPVSISPSATVNALASLVVPAAALVLAAQLTLQQHWRIASFVLILILAGCVLGLLQFSGANFDNPLINDIAGSVSGNFANRNHFALFAALGCVIAPVWGLRSGSKSRWTMIAAFALLPFLMLLILAAGSRAGILLGGIGLAIGFLIVRAEVLRKLSALPRWIGAAIVIAFALILIGAVAASIHFGRAAAIDRMFLGESISDLRIESAPYVFEAIGRYFPVGTGFGTFDPVYRIVEPDHLLRRSYFNHAHNDWSEFVLDGGIAALVLAAAAVGWLVLSTLRALRSRRQGRTLALVGSGILMLVMAASLPDYPARTPIVMTILVLAAVWLHLGSQSELPRDHSKGGGS